MSCEMLVMSNGKTGILPDSLMRHISVPSADVAREESERDNKDAKSNSEMDGTADTITRLRGDGGMITMRDDFRRI